MEQHKPCPLSTAQLWQGWAHTPHTFVYLPSQSAHACFTCPCRATTTASHAMISLNLYGWASPPHRSSRLPTCLLVRLLTSSCSLAGVQGLRWGNAGVCQLAMDAALPMLQQLPDCIFFQVQQQRPVAVLLQGAVFSTGRPTQRDWRIWAGYILSNDSPFPQTLPDPIYNSAVVLHLSSSLYALKPDSQDSGFSYRVRVLQSGDVYRWVGIFYCS